MGKLSLGVRALVWAQQAEDSESQYNFCGLILRTPGTKTAPSVATVSSFDIANIKSAPAKSPSVPYYYTGPVGSYKSFNVINGASSAYDYYQVGSVTGAVAGCAYGAAVTAPAFGAGCLASGPAGALILGITFGVWGFYEGGYGGPNAEIFSGAPDYTSPFPGR